MQYQDIGDAPLVTVAMAVYNAARFLESAVENILSQTYRNLDLLIIDDGSIDDSRAIIRRLEKRDSRIRVLLKEKNEGLSSVRNLSIREARGKYLLMVDADDLMDLDTIEKAVALAECKDADIVIWDYTKFYDEKGLAIASAPSSLTGINVADRKRLLKLPAFMPVRLIRTNYARAAALQYPLGLTKQDIPVHWQMMTDPNVKVALLPQRLFHYRQHNSTTTNRRDRSIFSLAYVMDIVGENLKKSGQYNLYRDEYLTSRLNLLHGMVDFAAPEYKQEALSVLHDRLGEDERCFIKKRRELLSFRTYAFYRMLEGHLIYGLAYRGIILARSVYRRIAK